MEEKNNEFVRDDNPEIKDTPADSNLKDAEKLSKSDNSQTAATDSFAQSLGFEASDDGEAEQYIEDDNQGKKKKRKKRQSGGSLRAVIFISVILIFSFALAGGIIMSAVEVMGMKVSSDIVQVNIPKGSSNQAIAEILKENKIIKFPTLFRFVAKSEEDQFHYGVFTLKPGMSYSEIFSILQQETDVEGAFDFTIVEGDTLYSIAKKLEKKGLCSMEGFVKFANSVSFGYEFEQYITEDSLKFLKIEGYLFPDTYRLYEGQDTEEILNLIFGNFDSKITEEMYDRMDELDMTLEQTITLASMVQKEAANTEDMAKVAGVFYNRLNNSSEYPKLQSDVTVDYVKNVIKKYSDENDQDVNNAYNTYKCTGLPAGPICNPGLDAINAALYPESSDYYYFCADTETGEVYYAKTLAQHEANLVKIGLG